MKHQFFIQNENGIPDTHNFVYNNKYFPIKYDFFKYASSYFIEHHSEIENIKNIDIINENDGNIEFTDYSIQSFIDYVQCKQISLDTENVIALNYLSKKYGVLSLTEKTEKYIADNHSELILQILTIHQQDPLFDIKKYEQLISDHLDDYFENEQLIKLEICILYRITTKYQQKSKNFKYADFLFKCLDYHGRKASVLFSDFDFSCTGIKYLIKLKNEYNSIFDFNCINSSIVDAFINAQKEHEKQIDLMKKEINELKQCYQPINENTEYFIESQDTHKYCLDVENSSKDNCSRIIVSKFHGGQSQRWRIKGNAIINVNSGRVLDIRSGENIGRDLIIYDHHGGTNQQWTMHDGAIKSPSGYCIEIKDFNS